MVEHDQELSTAQHNFQDALQRIERHLCAPFDSSRVDANAPKGGSYLNITPSSTQHLSGDELEAEKTYSVDIGLTGWAAPQVASIIHPLCTPCRRVRIDQQQSSRALKTEHTLSATQFAKIIKNLNLLDKTLQDNPSFKQDTLKLVELVTAMEHYFQDTRIRMTLKPVTGGDDGHDEYRNDSRLLHLSIQIQTKDPHLEEALGSCGVQGKPIEGSWQIEKDREIQGGNAFKAKGSYDAKSLVNNDAIHHMIDALEAAAERKKPHEGQDIKARQAELTKRGGGWAQFYDPGFRLTEKDVAKGQSRS